MMTDLVDLINQYRVGRSDRIKLRAKNSIGAVLISFVPQLYLEPVSSIRDSLFSDAYFVIYTVK